MTILKDLLFAVVDVETTGGKPHLTRVTEVAVYITDGKQILHEYSTLVNPQRLIDPFVVKLTGIDDKMVAGAPTFEEIAADIHQLLDGKVFVAHNVDFDFGILKREFFRSGLPLGNSKLCTVKLAKKYFRGYPSYSLGNICKHLAIENLGRHRAAGDALATAILFQKIYGQTDLEELEKDIWEGLDIKSLPPNIAKEQILALPEVVGILYLKDEKGEVLYLNACKNIYSTFVGLLKKMQESNSRKELIEAIKYIDYECFGNYLSASLHRYELLQKNAPKFNKKTGIKKYSHAISLVPDPDGYLTFKIGKSEDFSEAYSVKTTSKRSAEKLVNQLISKQKLETVIEQLPLYKQQHSPEMVKTYNAHFAGIFSKFQFYKPNFLIIADAVLGESYDVFMIENYLYKGKATVSEEQLKYNNINEIKDLIVPGIHNPDIVMILKENLKKNKYIIRYF